MPPTRFTAPKVPYRIALYTSVSLLLVLFLAFGANTYFGDRISRRANASFLTQKPASAPEPNFYPWDTRSQFSPVRQAIDGKTTEDLCAAFPKDLLRDIQPVLKTGHGVLHTRVEPQLQSVSACLDNLLIFSDVDEELGGHQVIDIIADLPTSFKTDNEQLNISGYYMQKSLADNGTLEGVSPSDIGIRGWELDKFKFLPQVSRAWRMRPEKRWYVFYEADTYLVWDNIFRLLENFDPDVPLYFGSPSPGRDGSWMANGGPGYLLSREAVRRLVKKDFGNDGAYVGSKLSERWEEEMMGNCCGDSVLGWAVHEDAKTVLSGLWPMFNPHPLHGVPFSDLYWCQPVISKSANPAPATPLTMSLKPVLTLGMHKTTAADMLSLWRWEHSRRSARQPLLYADLPSFLNLTTTSVREDWHNAQWDSFKPPPTSSGAHESFEACGEACKANEHCFQWMYHLRTCQFVRSFRLGQARAPEVEKWRSDEVQAGVWTEEEKRFMAGWDLEGIERWMGERKRQCEVVEWVRPSLKRIF